MNYNDIDNDIMLYAKKGLNIEELLSTELVNKDGFYPVKVKHYIPLLLLMPDDAERRDQIHTFLEIFEHKMYNGDINYRERTHDWVINIEEIKYKIVFDTDENENASVPLHNDDFYVIDCYILEADLSSDVKHFLNHACKEILKEYETVIEK